MAVVIFVFVFVSLMHFDELGPLRRYTIKKEGARDPFWGYPGKDLTILTIKGIDQDKLLEVLKRQFPESKGWSKPYIERGNCFVFESYKGVKFKGDYVIVVGHLIHPDSVYTIVRDRPMSALEAGMREIREAINGDARKM